MLLLKRCNRFSKSYFHTEIISYMVQIVRSNFYTLFIHIYIEIELYIKLEELFNRSSIKTNCEHLANFLRLKLKLA